jgi:hypothetical protein
VKKLGNPRRKRTLGDVVNGYISSWQSGQIRNPFATAQHINAERDERLGKMAINTATGGAIKLYLQEINADRSNQVLYTSADVTVEAREGWSADLQVPTADIKVINRHGVRGHHLHAVYNLWTGELIFAHLKHNS